MANALYTDTVQQVYIAYYGRAADPVGLASWEDALTTANGNLASIMTSFGTSAEATTLFGSLSNTAKVNALFQQMFGRDADTAGSAYYVAQLDAGTMTAASIALNVSDGATGDDATILTNKLAVAKSYTTSVNTAAEISAYAGDAAATTARTLLATVDATTATATFDVATSIAGLVTTAEAATPKTLALTIGADALTGGTGNDTFTGVSSTLSSAKTLGTSDVLDGAGGTDSLNVTVAASFTGMATAGSVSNIENINLTNSGTVARTFDATGVTGATAYTIDATKGLVNLTDLDVTPSITLSNYAKAGSFSAAFATGAAELTGATDAMTFTISALGTVEDAATSATEQKIVTATLTDIETVNLAATGDNVVALSGTDMLKLAVTGAGNVKVTTVPTSTTSIDASASTGNIVVDSTATTSTLTSISTGTGTDSVTYDEVDGAANMELVGGAGTDSLTLNSNGGTVQYSMSGFETLALGTITTGALTMSGSNTTELSTLSSVSTVAQAVSMVNMGAIDLTVNSKGATVDAGDISSNHTGTTVLNYTADAASVTAKTVQTPAAEMTFAGTSDLTVNVGAYTDNSGSDIVAAAATSLAINVASGKNSAATPAELTVFGGNVTAAKATSLTIVADGKIDTPTVTVAKAINATITNGANAGTMVLDAAVLEELTVVSGKTFDMSSSVLTKVQTADLTANDGLFDLVGETLPAISSLTVKGSGLTSSAASTTASSFQVGNIGGDNAYAITVNASGLKGGATTGTIDTGAGYDITVDANAVTGTVVLGNIGATTTGTNVTVSTAGTGGVVNLATVDATGVTTLTNSGASTFDVGAVTSGSAVIDTSNTVGAVTLATVTTTGGMTLTNSGTGAYTQTGALSAGVTGDVVVNMAGTLGAVSLGAMSGKTVNLDVGNTIGGVNASGVITALTSATLALSQLQANGTGLATITHAAAGTGLTLALTGGILADDIVVNDVVTTTGITVTGAMNTGTDTLLIDADASTAGTMAISIGGVTEYATSSINVQGATAAGTTQSITGGVGIDTIFFEVDDTLTSADTVVGGTGVDVLKLVSAGAIVDADFTNVSTMETISLGADTDLTIGPLGTAAGVTLVNVYASTTGAIAIDASTFTNALTITATNGGTGQVTITGGTGIDTILGDVGAINIIKGGLGADAITLPAAGAVDTIIMTTGGAIEVDTVATFVVGSGKDIINVDLSDLNALVPTLMKSDGATASAAVAAAAGTVTALGSAGGDYGAIVSDLTTITGATAYTAATLETAIEAGAFSGGNAAGDAILVLYDDTTSSYLAYVTINTAVANGSVMTDVTVTNILEITGLAAAETFLTNNFAIIA
jgi:S-layer protein